MKVIRLSSEMKEKLFNEYQETVLKEAADKLNKYKASLDGVTPEQKSEKAENKLKIYYTAEAYAKIVQLVFSHTQEIGWNMVVKQYKDGYRVEDVLVYPQKASAAYVEVDLTRYAMWKADPDKVSDEADANLFGQGHSHVNMEVSPSSRDCQQQLDEISLKGSGFYLFQIWNKKMDINSFFYDIDNNVFYDRNDIELIVEDGNMNSTEFVKESKDMLKQEPVPQTPSVQPKETKQEKRARRKPRSFDELLALANEEDDPDEAVFLDGYYPDYSRYPSYYYDW